MSTSQMMPNNPFASFEAWLLWLDSEDGLLTRARRQDKKDDYDFLALIPTPPGSAIFTVGDLRALVGAGRELGRVRKMVEELEAELVSARRPPLAGLVE